MIEGELHRNSRFALTYGSVLGVLGNVTRGTVWRMLIPEKLETPEDKLAYVVGVVTGHFAQMEDATNSVRRALGGDHTIAVGSPKYESISIVLDDCKNTFKEDIRFASIRDDALSLLGRVTEAKERRNDLIHRMWAVKLGPDGVVEYRMLQDILEHELSTNRKKRKAGPKGRTIEKLADVDDRLLHMQRSMNSLWQAVIRLSYWHNQPWTAEVELQMNLHREMVSGRFDLLATGEIRLNDRAVADALQIGH